MNECLNGLTNKNHVSSPVAQLDPLGVFKLSVPPGKPINMYFEKKMLIAFQILLR